MNQTIVCLFGCFVLNQQTYGMNVFPSHINQAVELTTSARISSNSIPVGGNKLKQVLLDSLFAKEKEIRR